MSHEQYELVRAEVCAPPIQHGARERLSEGQEGLAQKHQHTSGNFSDLINLPVTFTSPVSQLFQLYFLLSARRGHCPAAEGRAARDLGADIP